MQGHPPARLSSGPAWNMSPTGAEPLRSALERVARLAAAALQAPLVLLVAADRSLTIEHAAEGQPASDPQSLAWLDARCAEVAAAGQPWFWQPGGGGTGAFPSGAILPVSIPKARQCWGTIVVASTESRLWEGHSAALIHDLSDAVADVLVAHRALPPHLEPSPVRHVETSPSQQVVVLLNCAGQVQGTNANGQRWFRLLFHQEITPGVELATMLPPQEQTVFRERFAQALAGEPQVGERRFQVGGKEHWIAFTYEPVMQAEGNVEGVLFIARDITRHKQGEAALSTSEAQYRQLVERLPNMVAIHQSGRFVYVNQATCEMLGATQPEQLLGQPVLNFIHPDYQALVAVRVQQVIQDQRPLEQVEERFVRLDGREVNALVQSIPMLYQGERAALVVALDVSERRRAQAELEAREAHFRALIEHSFDLTVLVSSEGLVLYASPSANDYLGIAPEDAVGRNIVQFLHPGDLPTVTAKLEELKAQPGSTVRAEYRLRHQDGTWQWVEGVGTNALEVPGLEAIVVNHRDITERRNSQELLLQNEQQLLVLWQAATRQAQEMELLDRARTLLTRESDPQQVIRAIVEGIATTFGYNQVSVYLIEEGRLILQHQVGYHQVLDRIPLSQGVMGRAARTGQPVLVEDPRDHPEFIAAFSGIISEVAVPLLIHGQPVGVLNVESTQEVLTPDDLRLMVALSEHVSLSIERAQLLTETQRQLHIQTALRAAGEAIISSLDLPDVLHQVAEQLRQILAVSLVILTEYDALDNTMTVAATSVSTLGEIPVAAVGQRLDLSAMFPTLGFRPVHEPLAFHLSDPTLDADSRQQLLQYRVQSSLLIPLIVQGRVIAFAGLIEHHAERHFTPDEIELGQRLAEQAALVLHNARLYQQAQEEIAERRRVEAALRNRNEYLAVLHETSLAVIHHLNVDDLLESIVTRATEMVDAPHAFLDLLTADGTEMELQLGLGKMAPFMGTRLRQGEGLSGQVWAEGRTLMIENYSTWEQRLQGMPGDIYASIGIPLFSGSAVVGVLGLTRTEGERAFDADEVQMLERFAHLVSIALHNARLYQKAQDELKERRRAEAALRTRNTYQAALHDTALAVIHRLDVNELLVSIVTRAAELVGTPHTFLHLVDAETGSLKTKVGQGKLTAFVGTHVQRGEGLGGRVWETGRTLLVPDYSRWPGRRPGLPNDLGAIVGIPFFSEGQVAGVLGLASGDVGRCFNAEEVELLERFAHLASIALENARLYQQLQGELEERRRVETALRDRNTYLAALHDTALTIIHRLDVSDVLDSIITHAGDLAETPNGFIYLVNADEGYLELKVGRGKAASMLATRTRPNEGLCGKVWVQQRTLQVENYATWPARTAPVPEGVHASIGIPLFSGDQVVGVLGLAHEDATRSFTAEEVQLLERLAQLASIALENARLYGAAQQELAERRRVEAALRVSEERYALAARGANDGLWDWSLRTNEIFFSPRWKSMLGYGEAEIGNQPSEWFTRIHRDDLPRLHKNLGQHLAGQSAHLEVEYRMLHQSGDECWMLCRGLAVRDEMGHAYRIAGSHTDITQRKQAEAQLLHDAWHDSLTGLPNRHFIMDRLQRALWGAQEHPEAQFAVLFLDFDRFKMVNDSLGHLTGDRLLQHLGERLQFCLERDDIVARVGGDEFIILVQNAPMPDAAITTAECIQRTLGLPFRLGEHELFISASIGIVVSHPRYESPDDVLRDADIAMFQAKLGGRAQFKFFDEPMRQRAASLLQLETDLRRAVRREEFCLFYQPIVALTDQRIVGLEALLRWRHPVRGLLGPSEFIGAAEESGLILELGAWVARHACLTLRRWQRQFPGAEDLTISINLSGKQLMQADLATQLRAILVESQLNPLYLKLEIMENVMMEQAAEAAETLDQLRRLGLELQLDDFGTGYSSLSYLHHFPLACIKVDRSFIHHLGHSSEDAEIVRTIIQLAHHLGLEVVAEGVETPSQVAQLRALGCDYAQGYLFAHPMPTEEVERLLRQGRVLQVEGIMPTG